MSDSSITTPTIDYCTFCGMATNEVDVMIPGPLNCAFICDSCVGICFDLVVEQGGNPMKGKLT